MKTARTTALCICERTPSSLTEEINKAIDWYDMNKNMKFVQVQFSTHYDPNEGPDGDSIYSALLIFE